MNRIILIGNGFDLAHGLKTSYKHFIDNFWENEKKKIIEHINKYSGECVAHIENGVYRDNFIEITKCRYKNLITNIKGSGYEWFKNFSRIMSDTQTSVFIRNKFLEKISEKTHLENWVDIEEEYYIQLHECLGNQSGESVKKLNEEFLAVQKALEEYLTEQQNDNATEINETVFTSLFYEKYIEKYPHNPKYKEVYRSTDFLFLTFNYTNTEKAYIDDILSRQDIDRSKIMNIHIHGELGSEKNPIIFGYGDEIGEKYKIFEEANNNDYLEYTKSIKYLETNNYKKMLTFIEAGEYEIFVMGHSCGISDRTLLNTLFENENCKSIKVFFHKKDGKDNYSDVIRNISRNFNDKKLFRKIVLNKTECELLS